MFFQLVLAEIDAGRLSMSAWSSQPVSCTNMMDFVEITESSAPKLWFQVCELDTGCTAGILRTPRKLNNSALRFVQVCPTTAPDAIWSKFNPNSMVMHAPRFMHIESVICPIWWWCEILDLRSLCRDAAHTGRFSLSYCYASIFETASSTSKAFYFAIVKSTRKGYTKWSLNFERNNEKVLCRTQTWEYFFAIWSYRIVNSTMTLLCTEYGGGWKRFTFSLSLPLSLSTFLVNL